MKKVLFVDDDFLNTDMPFLVELECYDCEFVNASTCSEAIHWFDQQRFIVIILDMLLPIGDVEKTMDIIGYSDKIFGLKLLKYFRNKDKEVKIIGFSHTALSEIDMDLTEYNITYFCKTKENISVVIALISIGF